MADNESGPLFHFELLFELNGMKQNPHSNVSEETSSRLRIVEWQRRAAVLGRPKLPCLAPYHTLNLTAGCPNECRYCYAQSYDHHPGWGTVAFYSNMAARLKEEFPRMREKPSMVYFSTASEPLLPVNRILDDMFEIMEFLLARGVPLLISTKGIVQPRFAELFGRYRRMVHVQVGITTVDDSIRATIEPRATTVEERLANCETLLGHGVNVEARLDPLLPGLTDDLSGFDALFSALARRGVRRAVASYMFLRWRIKTPESVKWGDWNFREMRKMYTHKVTNYCGGGTIRMPSTDYRQQRYVDLVEIAHCHGINVKLCGCKNADITTDCCHPTPQPQATQLRFL